MVSEPQARILSRLAEFPRNLESAWDVPRDLCLPGLSEHLGVVRSALHAPLTELLDNGLIIERKAHVINGGSRKRKVYHLTELGRDEVSKLDYSPKKKIGELFGKPPIVSELYGRKELVDSIIDKKKFILTGLPGIGKSSILGEISKLNIQNGKTVRFANMESFKDLNQIFRDWGFEFTSTEAVLNSIKNDILIIDEFQEINNRHLNALEGFAKECENLIIASRAPLKITEGFEIIDVPPLDLESAIKILPNELESKEIVANRLGCHPLAIKMHDINSILPEEGDDLQAWISDVVLRDLGKELATLDELSLLPIPVGVDYLQSQEFISDLDDFALLRWFEHGVELHHLIRNVRSTIFSEEDYKKAADYWSTLHGDIARLVEMHLLLKSGQNIESYLMKNSESLMARSSAGLSALIADAIFRYPSQKLHRIAAIVAIERGEYSIASQHASEASASDLQHSLDLMQGKESEIAENITDARILLSEASRQLDDRLPGQSPAVDIMHLLDRIELNNIDESMKKIVLVAIAQIKHSWYIANNESSKASLIREQLLSISHEDDPIVSALTTRAVIAESDLNSQSFDNLIDKVFSQKGLKSTMLKLAIVNRCDGSRARDLISKIDLPSQEEITNLNSARRISAAIWFLRAKYQTHDSYSSMAEAISLWKNSLCPKASKLASEMLHKMI